jgi:hypothetical protein
MNEGGSHASEPPTHLHASSLGRLNHGARLLLERLLRMSQRGDDDLHALECLLERRFARVVDLNNLGALCLELLQSGARGLGVHARLSALAEPHR